MEVESRKRPHGDGDDCVHTKKRVLSSANGSPHVNGADAEEPTETDNLELFRKEAIFRRMKHYSRENERNQARVAELERRKITCEAGLAALSACWTQLVDAIRLLVRVENLPPVDIKTQEIFDITTHILSEAPPDLETSLKDNLDATQQLVTSFVQLSGSNRSSVSHDDMYKRAQAAQSQCTALRYQLNGVRAQLRDSIAQRESIHTALVAAESRADRLQSKTIAAMQSRAKSTQEVKEEEVVEESHKKEPSSPSVPPPDHNPKDLHELEILQETLRVRTTEMVDLERENAELRDQKNNLTIELKSASSAVIAENPYYKVLLDHASRLEHTVKETAEEVRRLREELDQLQSTRKEFEDDIIAANGQACQDLKGLLAKRDAENLRLRDQRDQNASELNERKQKDNLKMASLQELKALAESRSERILVLTSEVTRLKARLAALAGEEDLMNFILGDQSGGASYVKDLRAQLRAEQTRHSSLEQSLSALENRHPDAIKCMKAEAEARQLLEEAKRELTMYQSVFGDLSVHPPDVQSLSEQLRRKENEIQKLQLLETQHAQSETSLYTEIDKLSAAWEALERQVNSKVFDLVAMEDRLSKGATERAKIENKFYSAMREKEAVETERKTLLRNLEKQAKSIERLRDSEKNLMMQVGDLEKEVMQWKKKSEMHEARGDSSEQDAQKQKNLVASAELRADGYRKSMQEQDRFLEKKRAEWRRNDENLLRLKKEAERQAAKVQVVNSGTATQKEAELEHEATRLMSLLKCSTCNMRMRNTIINKCMHTFCKECVDTRISLRNRKCPYCNLAFAQSDIQSIFFQ